MVGDRAGNSGDLAGVCLFHPGAGQPGGARPDSAVSAAAARSIRFVNYNRPRVLVRESERVMMEIGLERRHCPQVYL